MSAASGPDPQPPAEPAVDMNARIAADIEREFGVTVEHSGAGWIARRDGHELARGQSSVALLALLPFSGI